MDVAVTILSLDAMLISVDLLLPLPASVWAHWDGSMWCLSNDYVLLNSSQRDVGFRRAARSRYHVVPGHIFNIATIVLILGV